MKSLLELIDESIKQSRVVVEGGKKVVLKHYTVEPGIVKWFIIKSLSISVQVYPYVFSPRERMSREISFFEEKPGGVHTPRVLEVNWDELWVKREFIEGDTFTPDKPALAYLELARTIALVHRGGYALGDSKHTNFIYSRDKIIYIVDAEQAMETEAIHHKAWDLVVLTVTLLYAYGPLKDLDPIYNRLRILYASYADYHSPEPLAHIYGSARLKTLLSILLPLPVSVRIIGILKEVASK